MKKNNYVSSRDARLIKSPCRVCADNGMEAIPHGMNQSNFRGQRKQVIERASMGLTNDAVKVLFHHAKTHYLLCRWDG